jgi:hypothetical protein
MFRWSRHPLNDPSQLVMPTSGHAAFGILGVAIFFLALFFPSPPAAPAFYPDISIVAHVTYWRPSPGGSIEITRGGGSGSGSRIDLSDGLDLGTADTPEGGVDVIWRTHRFSLAYEPLEYSGRTTLARPLIFHGATYPAGERVASDVALDFWIPRYDYEFVHLADVDFRAGLQLYVWQFDAHLTGSGSSGAIDQHRAFTHVMPAFTMAGGWGRGPWRLDAGFAGGVIGSDRYSLDLEGGLAWRPLHLFDLEIGYHWLKFRFHETTNVGDITSQGPFVGASFYFP